MIVSQICLSEILIETLNKRDYLYGINIYWLYGLGKRYWRGTNAYTLVVHACNEGFIFVLGNLHILAFYWNISQIHEIYPRFNGHLSCGVVCLREFHYQVSNPPSLICNYCSISITPLFGFTLKNRSSPYRCVCGHLC